MHVPHNLFHFLIWSFYTRVSYVKSFLFFFFENFFDEVKVKVLFA